LVVDHLPLILIHMKMMRRLFKCMIMAVLIEYVIY
jgi:hypothetical protein